MILLEPGNRILGETIASQLIRDENEEKRDPIDVRLCDFDDVTYRVTIDAKAKDTMLVSMNLPSWHQIENFGGGEALRKYYGDQVTEPVVGYNISLKYNLTALPAKPEDVIKSISLFKANIVGGVFDYYFTALVDGKKAGDPFKFDLRGDTTIFVLPGADRVTIIYSLSFHDKVDSAVAKVFMQEFVDARRNQQQAPPVQFNHNPPLELKAFGITEPSDNLGYLTFAVLKNHVDRNKKEGVIQVMSVLRNYIQYHLKCSKSFFHSRMRAKAGDLLKVLNRAKVIDESKEKSKKTISGRTFVRKDKDGGGK